jgi:hypothetical protein
MSFRILTDYKEQRFNSLSEALTAKLNNEQQHSISELQYIVVKLVQRLYDAQILSDDELFDFGIKRYVEPKPFVPKKGSAQKRYLAENFDRRAKLESWESVAGGVGSIAYKLLAKEENDWMSKNNIDFTPELGWHYTK